MYTILYYILVTPTASAHCSCDQLAFALVALPAPRCSGQPVALATETDHAVLGLPPVKDWDGGVVVIECIENALWLSSDAGSVIGLMRVANEKRSSSVCTKTTTSGSTSPLAELVSSGQGWAVGKW